jgi:1-acyl-sn-glycerol-3-phosphate acyltransferase
MIFLPLLAISTCFFVGLGMIIIILSDDRIANRTTGAWWARFNGYITPMRVDVRGREKLSRNTSYVVVSNHQSLYDIFVLFGWLGIDLKWVIKKELRTFPVFGYAAEKGGNILVDRSDPVQAYESLSRAKEKVKDGTSIIILPEGTRSRTGELGDFKKGAFWLARELDLPLLPITLVNTGNILPPGTLDLYPGRATMFIHEPVEPGLYDDMEELIADVRDTIGAVLEGRSRARGKGAR